MAEDQESSFKWFLLISFSISWTSFFSGVLYGILGKIIARDVLFIFGTIGPIIAFLSLMATYKNKDYNKDFWRRIYYPKIGPKWLILGTVLLPILLNLSLVLFSLIGTGPTLVFGNLLSKNGLFLLFSLIGILGWYGYAFPLIHKKISNKLQEWKKQFTIKPFKNMEKLTSIFAGLIIGVLWSLWQVPIVFIFESYPESLGVSSFGFWEYFLLIPIQSVTISWVFSKTENSTFTVIIFFLAEITRFFFEISLTFQIIRFVLWILIAGFFVFNEWGLNLIPFLEKDK
ncbi:MAG: hypothetical protein EU530_10630 [Promethearchaeota archaeon]|nr:MAG: hypothetical protein EU530_10630 [Candidatus Lokiarchaeota archaeon]